MKIVAVYNRYLNRGGEDESFEAETNLLQHNGCDVRVVAEEFAYPGGLRQKFGLALSSIWSVQWYTKFRALLREFRPDAVHAHNVFPVISPSVYYACKQAGVPVIQTLHNYRLLCPAATFFRDGQVCEECVAGGLWRGISHGCYRGSRAATASVALMLHIHRRCGTWMRMIDRYIALTDFARRKFVAAGFPENRISLKPNFIPCDPGQRSGQGDCALFIGRLAENKGVRTLLFGWQLLHSRIPLHILGDGPLRAELEGQICESARSISLWGRVSHARVLDAIKRARFLILPSQCYENFPMVIVEAFACGVPVICSRLGAMQELVEGGCTGLHFAPGVPEDLASKVEWAWTHPKEMEAMGGEARREYEAKYTAERNYAMLMEIYRRALSTQREQTFPPCELAVH